MASPELADRAVFDQNPRPALAMALVERKTKSVRFDLTHLTQVNQTP